VFDRTLELPSLAESAFPSSPGRPISMRVCDVSVVVRGLPGVLRTRFGGLVRPFVVRATEAKEAKEASAALCVEVQSDARKRQWTISQHDEVLRTFNDPDQLLIYLEWLTLSQALEATQTCAVFHAAALARGSSVVLLLANSGAGKTTLTLGLIARGWEPLADDITLVDLETLAIAPFPRCFHVDDSTMGMLPEEMEGIALQRPGKLAGYVRPARWAPGGQPATVIVGVERCPTCMSARYSLLQAAAAGALLTQAIRNKVSASQIAHVAVRVAAGARGCYRLRNGPLEGALNLIEGAAS
jgi:hypothetical protein